MGGGVWVCVVAREQQQQQQALCVPFICGWGGGSVGGGGCLGGGVPAYRGNQLVSWSRQKKMTDIAQDDEGGVSAHRH